MHDTVSFHLEGVPIEQAFEQLIDQHHLTYSYNPATKTVFINAASGGGAADAEECGVSSPCTPRPIRTWCRPMNNLRLGLGGLHYDAASQHAGDFRRCRPRQADPDPGGKSGSGAQARQYGGAASLGPEEVKVIPLRFTDVGPSTRQFQGKTVTVPGIADTLRSVLGLDERPAGDDRQRYAGATAGAIALWPSPHLDRSAHQFGGGAGLA